MAESAVTHGSSCAAVILQWVMAVVTGGGLDHSALSFHLAAAWNEFEQRIGHVLAFFPTDFSADHMGGAAVIIGGQGGFESVCENTGTEAG